ncbi:capsular biosynthesis protein [Sporosarcina thermotolerans]|uniref:Tyrosine-protein phosphatase n=1 Tax=Sporosarcina thermotolerans TaxID=633404 RepID=A0AAW9A7X2_9BACL|nr:CpsB/CapC family capsule biosynthesis tyrosine phosphatase [Sporosarcina thermotolerans]MDW0116314.1 capsular biosynthesis protein [Sporosarcina thermotolerans]WHT49996.1 capsular biosynthesis protein [Sporosarcina thermotolerans]
MHTHILHGVDDGPDNLEGSMKIIHSAVNEGITEMIATPHTYNPHFHVTAQETSSQVHILRELLKQEGIPITIHTGQEVRLHDTIIENYKAGEILTLAESNYLLLELPSQTVPSYTVKVIEQLTEIGIIPIIAHPERNKAIAEKPERLQRLIRHGAYAQITAGSLSGHFGKGVQDLSLRLIEANCIHTYGSDVHNMETRPLEYEKGLGVLEKKKQLEMIDILLENNERIIANKPLTQFEFVEVRKKSWWKIGMKA